MSKTRTAITRRIQWIFGYSRDTLLFVLGNADRDRVTAAGGGVLSGLAAALAGVAPRAGGLTKGASWDEKLIKAAI